MRFTFERTEIDRDGSYEIIGAGFRYEYIAPKSELSIFDRAQRTHLVSSYLKKNVAKHPLFYVRYLEKITQVRALILTENKSINLAETLSREKIIPILDQSIDLARFANALDRGRFSCFSKCYREKFLLKDFKIRKIHFADNTTQPYLKAKIKTDSGYKTEARANSIARVMSTLARQTMQDIVIMEYKTGAQARANELMNMSSQMSAIGKVLDKNFIPKTRIVPENPFKNTAAYKKQGIH